MKSVWLLSVMLFLIGCASKQEGQPIQTFAMGNWRIPYDDSIEASISNDMELVRLKKNKAGHGWTLQFCLIDMPAKTLEQREIVLREYLKDNDRTATDIIESKSASDQGSEIVHLSTTYKGHIAHTVLFMNDSVLEVIGVNSNDSSLSEDQLEIIRGVFYVRE
ncbi:MAG: hypothetical protein KF784_09760 [Fimbriimonadaceae bacterium]|nr:hypothetical protein [Fimbriimonadaceae bacterium]